MSADRTGGRGLYRGGLVEELVFGTRDGSAIDAAVDAFCRARLGAAVADALFRATSVGVVFGVRLENGRRVVVKAHQPRESRQTLDEVHRVQAHLHREGFPSPAPLVAPASWHARGGRPAALGGGSSLYGPDTLWPRHAHAPIFDFEATAAGAEWIDAIAAKAKRRASAQGELVVGHHDWSGKHFRFAGGA